MDTSNLTPEQIAELQKKNCIFCKIIKREIPSYEIYRDDKVIVILDINPANEGHCLIMPIEHYQILPQIPENLIKHMAIIAKRTSKLLLKSLGIKGTTMFIANGAIAGQKSPHFMLHLISRKPNDMLFNIPKKNIEQKKLEDIKQKLQIRMMQMTGKRLEIENKNETINKNETSKKTESEQNNNKKIDIDKISKLFS
ncbi:MAG: HIT domain-containing protein [Candidatus Woesearchaeota archaeon]